MIVVLSRTVTLGNRSKMGANAWSDPTTTRLARLRNITAEPRVAMLADHYEADWDRLWWARADGTAAILAGRAEIAAPLALLARRYPRYRADPPGGPVIRVQVGRWVGWAASAG